MDSMQCRIISIGDELLIGDTTNTNARWMGQVLTEAGVEVRHIATVKDDLDVIKREITDSLSTADLVLTTGGLGPTHDDITKQAVAEVFDTPLIVHEPTDRKSTRLNSSHVSISYAVFCLKKKKLTTTTV